MKKTLYLLALGLLPLVTNAQSTGPIAHWKMNGNALDVTGNGHDGTIHGAVTPAAGKDGRSGTGYYFSGDNNSYIDVAYKADLNVSQFSICATVKIMGFYGGECQTNIILQRGTQYQSGSYELFFSDNFYDNANCFAFDSTREVFAGALGPNNFVVTPWQYTPTIVSNRWYSVVQTFDGSIVKTYVDGMLMSGVTMGSGVGTDNSGLRIGTGLNNTGQFPYPFKGVMDDLRLYNRVLSPAEISTYTNATLGVSEKANDALAFSLFPNPARTQATLQLAGNIKGNISVFNTLGQSIRRQPVNGQNNTIDLSGLPAGVYHVMIQAESGERATRSLTIE